MMPAAALMADCLSKKMSKQINIHLSKLHEDKPHRRFGICILRIFVNICLQLKNVNLLQMIKHKIYSHNVLAN